MKKLVFITLFQFVFGSIVFAQTPFITTWKTDNPGGSANDQITIPTTGTGYNYSVAWEKADDATVSGTDGPFTGDATLIFPQVGTYRVSISGDFPRIFFNFTGDREKLLTVEQWGSNPWQSMGSAFSGCSNLTIPAQDLPDLANVTDMSRMFREATSFNQDIGSWDVSNVTNMSLMFQRASTFNQNLETWDVKNVTNMLGMFAGAIAFNQNIGTWNVGNVTNMSIMFGSATTFNQDIGTWNVSSVTDMGAMFFGTTAFNQNLGEWNIENVTIMFFMFDGSGLSVDNYDSTLIGWSALPALQTNITLDADGLQYCNAEAARDTLINTFNWTILDAGRNCSVLSTRLASKPASASLIAQEQEKDQRSIIQYPNPTTDQFITIFPQALETPAHWVLTDPMGKEVAGGNLAAGTTSQVTLTNTFAPGTYFYRVFVRGEIIQTKRIIVAR